MVAKTITAARQQPVDESNVINSSTTTGGGMKQYRNSNYNELIAPSFSPLTTTPKKLLSIDNNYNTNDNYYNNTITNVVERPLYESKNDTTASSLSTPVVKTPATTANTTTVPIVVPNSINNTRNTNTNTNTTNSTTSNTNVLLEVDYDTNVTELYKAITNQDWDTAIQICTTDPKQAATWVVRRHTTTTSDIADAITTTGTSTVVSGTTTTGTTTTVGNTNTNKNEIMWRFLPIHSACARQPTYAVIDSLINAYKDGIKCRDDQGMYPIHYACGNQASYTIIQLLLYYFPAGASQCDPRGMVPLHYIACWGPSTTEVVSGNEDNTTNTNEIKVIDLLLQIYPNAIHAQDIDGITPLGIALDGEYDNKELVIHILQKYMISIPKRTKKLASTSSSSIDRDIKTDTESSSNYNKLQLLPPIASETLSGSATATATTDHDAAAIIAAVSSSVHDHQNTSSKELETTTSVPSTLQKNRTEQLSDHTNTNNSTSNTATNTNIIINRSKSSTGSTGSRSFATSGYNTTHPSSKKQVVARSSSIVQEVEYRDDNNSNIVTRIDGSSSTLGGVIVADRSISNDNDIDIDNDTVSNSIITGHNTVSTRQPHSIRTTDSKGTSTRNSTTTGIQRSGTTTSLTNTILDVDDSTSIHDVTTGSTHTNDTGYNVNDDGRRRSTAITSTSNNNSRNNRSVITSNSDNNDDGTTGGGDVVNKSYTTATTTNVNTGSRNIKENSVVSSRDDDNTEYDDDDNYDDYANDSIDNSHFESNYNNSNKQQTESVSMNNNTNNINSTTSDNGVSNLIDLASTTGNSIKYSKAKDHVKNYRSNNTNNAGTKNYGSNYDTAVVPRTTYSQQQQQDEQHSSSSSGGTSHILNPYYGGAPTTTTSTGGGATRTITVNDTNTNTNITDNYTSVTTTSSTGQRRRGGHNTEFNDSDHIVNSSIHQHSTTSNNSSREYSVQSPTSCMSGNGADNIYNTRNINGLVSSTSPILASANAAIVAAGQSLLRLVSPKSNTTTSGGDNDDDNDDGCINVIDTTTRGMGTTTRTNTSTSLAARKANHIQYLHDCTMSSDDVYMDTGTTIRQQQKNNQNISARSISGSSINKGYSYAKEYPQQQSMQSPVIISPVPSSQMMMTPTGQQGAGQMYSTTSRQVVRNSIGNNNKNNSNKHNISESIYRSPVVVAPDRYDNNNARNVVNNINDSSSRRYLDVPAISRSGQVSMSTSSSSTADDDRDVERNPSSSVSTMTMNTLRQQRLLQENSNNNTASNIAHEMSSNNHRYVTSSGNDDIYSQNTRGLTSTASTALVDVNRSTSVFRSYPNQRNITLEQNENENHLREKSINVVDADYQGPTNGNTVNTSRNLMQQTSAAQLDDYRSQIQRLKREMNESETMFEHKSLATEKSWQAEIEILRNKLRRKDDELNETKVTLTDVERTHVTTRDEINQLSNALVTVQEELVSTKNSLQQSQLECKGLRVSLGDILENHDGMKSRSIVMNDQFSMLKGTISNMMKQQNELSKLINDRTIKNKDNAIQRQIKLKELLDIEEVIVIDDNTIDEHLQKQLIEIDTGLAIVAEQVAKLVE